MRWQTLQKAAINLGLITVAVLAGNQPLKAQHMSEGMGHDPQLRPNSLEAPENATETFDVLPSVQSPSVQSSPLTDIEAWSSDYRLGPGDVLNVGVFEAEEYSGEVIVLQDGSVTLPRAGKVFVQGYTLQESTAIIAAAYTVYIRNPIVTLQPVRFRPVQIGIAGEVKRPGSYVISGVNDVSRSTNRDAQFPTLTQAIAEAGGITSEADLRQVELRRQVGPNREQVLQVDLWDLIQVGDLGQDLILQSGDEVVIPTAVALTPEESTRLASASFAPETIQVYVAGEVEDPGVVEVPLNAPLNQALLVAGGFNRRAERGVVELVRVNPDGTAAQENFEINFAAGVGDPNNPILRDQDIIVVDRSGFARIGDSTDILLNPITRVLNLILGIERLVF